MAKSGGYQMKLEQIVLDERHPRRFTKKASIRRLQDVAEVNTNTQRRRDAVGGISMLWTHRTQKLDERRPETDKPCQMKTFFLLMNCCLY